MNKEDELEKLYSRIMEDKDFDHTIPMYHGLDLLITIGDVQIYITGKNLYQIDFNNRHYYLKSIDSVINTLKTNKAIWYYLNN